MSATPDDDARSGVTVAEVLVRAARREPCLVSSVEIIRADRDARTDQLVEVVSTRVDQHDD